MSPATDSTKIGILEEKVDNLQDIVDKQGNLIERLREQVSSLSTTTAETKVYVGQIFTMLEDIKTSIKMLSQANEKTAISNHNMWVGVFRQFSFMVVGGAITFIVYYLVGHKS